MSKSSSSDRKSKKEKREKQAQERRQNNSEERSGEFSNTKQFLAFGITYFIIQIVFIFLYAFKYEYSLTQLGIVTPLNPVTNNTLVGASIVLGLSVLLLVGKHEYS